MCYFIFTYRGVKIALKTNNDFYKAVAILLTTVFGFQTFIIIGGVIKMIPLTGITLPFVSYGRKLDYIKLYNVGNYGGDFVYRKKSLKIMNK